MVNHLCDINASNIQTATIYYYDYHYYAKNFENVPLKRALLLPLENKIIFHHFSVLFICVFFLLPTSGGVK